MGEIMMSIKQFLRDRMVQLVAVILLLTHYVSPVFASDQDAYNNLKIFIEALNVIDKIYVEPVDQKKLLQAALNGMLQPLDPHSAFLTADMYKELEATAKGSFGGIGLEVTILNSVLTVVAPIEGRPAYKSGIKAGDQIIKIDDNPTKDMTIAEVAGKLRGPEGTKVKITIMRKTFTKPRDFIIARTRIKIPSVRYSYMEHDIGYIRISHFQEKTTDELKQAYFDLKKRSQSLTGLILDLRNNPGGLLEEALLVSEFFLEEGRAIVSIKGRDASAEEEFTAEADGVKPTCPIVLLVNEGSASAAEIVTGALQDNGRAVILGTRTFGKGSVQSVIPFEDGSAIMLTIALYYTPKGRSIQAEGIIPDVQVEFTEPVEKEELEPAIREKDIERHIKGEEELKARQGMTGAKEDFDTMKDNQLKVAVELLKSWEILEHKEKN
ncbi:MAG: S41 family peptidase [Syntrophales bacterium LBB04]|nr:S41 family peptidase [Syntrophales bacterium LBB04]